ILIKFVGVSFLPEMDMGEIYLELKRPAGTSLEETDKTFKKAERIIRENVPEAEMIYTSVGAGEGFQALLSEGSHTGSIRIKLVDREKRKRSALEIENVLRELLEKELPEAKVSFTSLMSVAGLESSGADIEIYGYNFDELRRIAKVVEEKIKGIKGVADIRNSLGEEGRPQIKLEYKRDKMYDLGLSTSYVSRLIRTALEGSVASKFRERGEEYDVLVRLKKEDRSKIEDILNLNILTPRGVYVKLQDVVDVIYTSEPTVIERQDQKRVARISFRAVGRPLGEVIEDVKKELAGVNFYPEQWWKVGGSGEDMQKSLRWLGYALIVAMCLVYMVMASEFESLRDPFIIFLTVPFSLIGVSFMLFLTGTTLSVISMIGVIMLVGIVVNNSIVLVDYTNLLRKRGKDIFEAAREAGRTRFRPVVMTALTTILAMIPLALEIGPGAENWAPMARSVIGGLLAGTFVTLLIIPVIYTLFEQRKVKRG
ncbi:efflux RND transporter permease subunit, partial [Candidatus Aerophobetes bacterium]|nr:efflux RND transporter permease subunit [Candidatus Aerophobetes bacterium]